MELPAISPGVRSIINLDQIDYLLSTLSISENSSDHVKPLRLSMNGGEINTPFNVPNLQTNSLNVPFYASNVPMTMISSDVRDVQLGSNGPMTIRVMKPENLKFCTKCKKQKWLWEFRIKPNGEYTKHCIVCVDYYRCEHNKQKNKCKECGGSAICEHRIERSSCKKCKGGSICIHNRARSRCRECGGGSFCEHNRARYKCPECNGAGICEHMKQKHACRICYPAAFCEHDRKRDQCRECGGSAFCVHNIRKTHCEQCGGGSLCSHKKPRYKCKLCDGSVFCIHEKERNKCPTCDPKGHLKSIVSHRVWAALKDDKVNRTLEYLGCDIESYRTFIESKFTEGMSWDNYGEWQIDHIIPIMYQNPTLEEVIARLHWSNTQPLWREENAAKGNKYIG